MARLLAATAPAWGLGEAGPAAAAAAAQRPAAAARAPASGPPRPRELLSFDTVI